MSEPSSALRALFAPQPQKIYGNDSENEDASPRALVTEMRPFHVFGGAHLRIVRFDPCTAANAGAFCAADRPVPLREGLFLIDENTTLPEGTHVFAHARRAAAPT